jgi:hypothetical protein
VVLRRSFVCGSGEGAEGQRCFTQQFDPQITYV